MAPNRSVSFRSPSRHVQTVCNCLTEAVKFIGIQRYHYPSNLHCLTGAPADLGAAGISEALYTISNDMQRIQTLLPELSPQDRYPLRLGFTALDCNAPPVAEQTHLASFAFAVCACFAMQDDAPRSCDRDSRYCSESQSRHQWAICLHQLCMLDILLLFVVMYITPLL